MPNDQAESTQKVHAEIAHIIYAVFSYGSNAEVTSKTV